MRYAMVRTRRRYLSLTAFSHAAGVHPDLVRRLVRLGLLEPYRDPTGGMWFPPGQLVTLARIQRLRAGFGLNYAAVGLVVQLLDRLDELEARLRRASARETDTGGGPWTPTA